jgi:gamma-glutamyl:cysteine ligase YbdK (ATP-grasp superfamily)
MDTSALETAAHRYKRADDTLKAARDTLQAEAVAALRAGARPTDVARITEWSREYLRRLRDDADKRDAEAEVATLRQQVAELRAAADQPDA